MKAEFDYVAVTLAQESKAKSEASSTTSAHVAEPRHGHALTICGFVFFHALNATLGIAGFLTVAFGLFFSVAFLPLCCLGVAVLKVICVTVDALAWLDIQLANSIDLHKPQLKPYEPFALENGTEEEARCMDASDLSRVQMQMTHILYFLVVKPFMSVSSIAVLALAIILPAQLLTGAHATVIDWVVDGRVVHPELISVLMLAGFWLLGITGIPLIARASWHFTRRFCANPQLSANFSTV